LHESLVPERSCTDALDVGDSELTGRSRWSTKRRWLFIGLVSVLQERIHIQRQLFQATAWTTSPASFTERRRWRRLPTVLCMKGECVRTFVQRRVERSKKGRAVEVEAERKLVRLRLVTVAEKRLSPSSERERAEP
jgi:hypothetical protein